MTVMGNNVDGLCSNCRWPPKGSQWLAKARRRERMRAHVLCMRQYTGLFIEKKVLVKSTNALFPKCAYFLSFLYLFNLGFLLIILAHYIVLKRYLEIHIATKKEGQCSNQTSVFEGAASRIVSKCPHAYTSRSCSVAQQSSTKAIHEKFQ